MIRRFTLFNDPEFLVGRKAICNYLDVSWRDQSLHEGALDEILWTTLPRAKEAV